MRRSASIVWPLIVFLVSVSAGAWLSTQRRAAAISPAANRSVSAAGTSAEGIARAFATDEAMLTAIMSAVAQDEPLLRSHQLHNTVGRLSSGELSALFEKAVKVADAERRDSLISVLLTRWIAVDPVAARAAVRPYLDRFRSAGYMDWRPERRGADAAVSLVWAEKVPEETLEETMANPDANWAGQLAYCALSALSGTDPARQLETLARMPESRLRSEMSANFISALARKDCAAAEAYLNLVTDPRRRARLQSEILGALAERDPEAGLARLGELGPNLSADTNGIRLVTEMLRGVSKKDPKAALAAIDGLPEILKTQALGSVLAGWADQDPVAALTWGAANGVNLMEAKGFLNSSDSGGMSWRNLLMVAFGRDKEKTLDWIRTLPASAERDSMIRAGLWNGTFQQQLRIYSELTPAGQNAAAGELVRTSLRYGGVSAGEIETWLKDQPPGPIRVNAIQELANHQARNAPDRANELANAWPPGPDRDAALRGIVSSLNANSNPLRALEFARQLGNSTARESSFEEIAKDWMSEDKPAARAWITSAPELSSEQKRVLLRQADEQ